MAKLDAAAIAALKALFDHGDTMLEASFQALFDAMADAAEDHDHVATGGPGSATGDAAAVINLQSGLAGNKPAAPAVGDIYIETDTSKVYACFTAEVWSEFGGGDGMLNITLNPEAAIFPPSSFPTLYKLDGSNFSWYEARFDDTVDQYLFFKVPIPASYTQANLKATIFWKAAATSGAVVWVLSHYDRASGEVLDTTPTETQSVTHTVEGTTEYIGTCFVTFTTHPADNDLLILKAMRDADHASDTMAGDAKLLTILIEEQ